MFDSLIHLDLATAACVWTGPGRLRYVAVERPNLGADSSRDLALAAVVRERTEGHWDEPLSEVAAAIGSWLTPAPGRYPGWAFFAGVDLSDTDVTCCVAGPHRVHLIQGGRIIESTHEHTVQYDGPPANWPSLPTEDLDALASVVVRSIGEPATRPPQVTRWSVPGPCEVVVVSADFYGSQSPSAYALSVRAKFRSPDAITGSCALLTRR